MSVPPQHQKQQPGKETLMNPAPEFIKPGYKGSDKLKGKVVVISGGDSGIGRATAVLAAREGADVGILYLNESEDARETERLVKKEGRKCMIVAGDIGSPDFCKKAIRQVEKELGRITTLINNAAEQHPKADFTDISPEQLERTFKTNIFSYFYLAQAAVPTFEEGDTIVNITSVTAYRGSEALVDYSSSKGAITAFTRSLSLQLASKKIRVNGVAPGPIWTPLIPSTFSEKKVSTFGDDTPLGRPGQPSEVAPCCIFLASDDSSYMTGQILHPNGGEVING